MLAENNNKRILFHRFFLPNWSNTKKCLWGKKKESRNGILEKKLWSSNNEKQFEKLNDIKTNLFQYDCNYTDDFDKNNIITLNNTSNRNKHAINLLLLREDTEANFKIWITVSHVQVHGLYAKVGMVEVLRL